MRCIERGAAWAVLLALAGCAPPAPPEPVSGASVAAAPAAAPEPVRAAVPDAAAPAVDWNDYRLRAARRIALANGPATFSGEVPPRLRSIPVLQVHLNRDGSVRQIAVLRTPRFSLETVGMAMAAVRRAAPFEPVGRLPRPWQFNETFLYNDDLKFQLRSLVAAP